MSVRLQILRDIVADWVNELFFLPPFPSKLTSVIEQVDIAEQIQVPDTIRRPPNFENVDAPR